MISIITPFKNAAPFLKECVESVLAQTETDWEWILVNDHSTDQGESILESFTDTRIRIVTNQGKGIIDALNTAYSLATGKYITRMDADDVMSPRKLEILLTLLRENGTGFVATGHVQYFSNQPIGPGYSAYQDWINSLCLENTHWKELYKECVLASPCWMTHRPDFEKAGAFNNNRYPEDYDLVFRMYAAGLQVVSCNEVLHLWREHSLRTSRNHSNYEDNQFSKLKCHYFLKLHFKPNHTLVIWGAGNKAKDIVTEFQKSELNLIWVTQNPSKEDKTIKGISLQAFNEFSPSDNMQHIITFTDETAKEHVVQWMDKRNLKNNEHYFFFG